MLREIAEYDKGESWRGEGFLSMEDWLIGRCRMGHARARTLVSVARRTEHLPVLSNALRDGQLTVDVAAPLAAVATPANEAKLAEDARQWTPRQAQRAAAELRGTTRAESGAAFRRRCVRFNDDRHSLWAQLTADSYALVKSAITSRARRYDHPTAGDPNYIEFESRCADALVEVCVASGRRLPPNTTQSTKTDRDSRSGAARGGQGFREARTTMVVHVDLDRLLHGDGYGQANVEWVGPISADVARRLVCNADLLTLSYESPGGTVLDQKVLDRDPTPSQRIAVRRRDGGCRFPACGKRNVTDVHHIELVSEQGPTELSNLITLCSPHHSRVHELGWRAEGDAQAEVRFVSPHGQILASTPVRPWDRVRE